jgi:hypothetical protein
MLEKSQGFESEKEFHHLVASTDTTTPEKYAAFKRWLRFEPGVHHTIRLVMQQASWQRDQHGFKLMAVQDHKPMDGGLSTFMGLPLGRITLWRHHKEIVLFVSREQRDLYLKAFPEATAI